ncbi:MAG: PQQ-dependent sugar dehydrogenase [Sphingopyxis sp.]|nr:PQQ-dependent sugar dehydrogenase [Sphingopyxis sp.]
MRMRIFAALAPLILASCGGGGGGGGQPPAGNSPPSFTSAQTASVVENTTNAYQATASDPDGDALTFSIDGGADAGLFLITSAGALRFNTAPDYSSPADADRNNVYNIQLRVSDGRASATLTVNITVTNSADGIAVVRVAPVGSTSFNRPVYLAPIPGDSSNVYVVENGGGVYRFNPTTGSSTRVLNITDISTGGERGLLGLAVDPGNVNRLMIVATAPDGAVQVRRYTLGTAQPETNYITALSTPHADSANHNGGWIGYGPDGYIYVAVGDGATGGDPAQDTNSRLGKILRLAVDPANANRFVPAPGNPYISGGGDPYVFARGLRNPFRASFQGSTLVIGDVGESNVEEISMMPTSTPGLNFGWPFMEGTRVNRSGGPSGLTPPVAEYAPALGRSVIGGYVYRGPIASLRGQYVFGDFISANVWTLPFADFVQGQTLPSSRFANRNDDFRPDTDTLRQLASFGEDSAGNLYIVSISGNIFMVRPRN